MARRQEPLQLWSLAGAAVICGSTLGVALLEQRRVAAAEAARGTGGLSAAAGGLGVSPAAGGIALVAHGTNGGDRPRGDPPERSMALAGPTAAQWSHLRRLSTDG